MKILLSAYACEPNKGSEPGVGWGWALELSKYHKVWVLTRDNNEKTIVEYLKLHPEYRTDNLQFIYVGLSKNLTFWKKGRRGMRLFYMMWQHKATRVASEWHEKIHFDLIQHVTFVSYTQPTYMYKLGIPLIWGPVSGGENIPSCVGYSMTKKEQLIEIVRKISQSVALMTPSIRKTMKATEYILVTTEESKNRMPRRYQEKTILMPAIGIDKMQEILPIKRLDDKKRIIMAGRLIYWKAFDIGLKGFLKIADKYPDVELHILGEGNKKEILQELAGEYLNKQVFFEDPVEHDNIFNFYRGFDIFLNTTLRDSGCMTMMEAMSVGIPCVAVATGGPAILLKDFKEYQIRPQEYKKCIDEVADKLSFLLDNEERRKELAKQQYAYAESVCTFMYKIELLQKLYEQILRKGGISYNE